MNALDFVLTEHFASDPNALGADLLSVEQDMLKMCNEHGHTEDAQNRPRAVLVAVYRNPALPLARLRKLVAVGNPDALANPRADRASPKRWRNQRVPREGAPTALEIAMNPATSTEILLAMEMQANAALRDFTTVKPSLNPVLWRSALHRNSNFHFDRLRLLLSIGNTDAWANPAASIVLMERPLDTGSMKHALTMLGLHLLGLDTTWVSASPKRLRAYEDRLAGHQEWRRWAPVLADLQKGKS